MSYTLDRLFDERPTLIEIVGRSGDIENVDYLMHVQYEQVAPDKADGRPGTRMLIGPEDTAVYYRVSIANQVWAADVIDEDENGNLLFELTNNEDAPSTVGTRVLCHVTGFTP